MEEASTAMAHSGVSMSSRLVNLSLSSSSEDDNPFKWPGNSRQLRSLPKSRSAFASSAQEDDEDEDSDAEFLVHPALRGLTKTQTLDGIARIRARPAPPFQMELSKLLASTERLFERESEVPLPNFVSRVDDVWPEPDDCPRPDPWQRASVSSHPPSSLTSHHGSSIRGGGAVSPSCWSSPPEVFLDSIPRVSTPDSQKGCWSAPELVIDSDDEDSVRARRKRRTPRRRSSIESEDSIRISCHSSVSSFISSPLSRPSSPLFDLSIPVGPSLPSSQSMFVDETPALLRSSTRRSSQDDDIFMRHYLRCASPGCRNFVRAPVAAHRKEQKDDDDSESWVGKGDEENEDRDDFDAFSRRARALEGPPERLVGAEEEARAMWEMRRSATSDCMNRPRRLLPRRPDEDEFEGRNMPTSLSMYERPMEGGELFSIRVIRDFGGKEGISRLSQHWNQADEPPHDFTIRSRPRPHALPHPLHHNNNLDRETPMAQPANQQPLNLNQSQRFGNFETPVSPPANVLPSSSVGSGRRLPALPVKASSLLAQLGHLPMAQPPAPPEEHRLCFGMDASRVSNLSDSQFFDDGINGNQQRPARKSTFFSGAEDSSGVSSCCDSQQPTHRVQSAFIPRHDDELLLDIGDAVRVDRECDDHWCFGMNLRTGQSGIFPSAVVCEIDLVEEICMGALPTNATKVMSEERDTFYLTMLASIEVAHHKGNDVLIQAMNKVLGMYKRREEVLVPQTVLMEVSFRGIHVIDKRRKNFFQCPSFDFFYSLQNISFCGAHPKQLRYFGFITKHPLLPRFACHVFLSNESTQPIVEAIGRAFKRSYDEYMAFAHPTEDIYLE